LKVSDFQRKFQSMKNIITFLNKFLAIILSLVFSITLLISFLSFPLELVLLNYQNYLPVLENEKNLPVYSEIVSGIMTSQLSIYDSLNQLPSILSNQENLKNIINKYIPSDWSLSVFKDITDHIINYLNFRIPDSSMKIDVSILKSVLILKSESIAKEYISSLPRCSKSINEGYSGNSGNLNIYQLPPCKPSDSLLQAFIEPTGIYLEDFINRLPTSVSFNGALSFDKPSIDRYFYFYTIARWALRLLPLIAVCLLIAIALLLKSDKYVMLRWIGSLLIFLSGMGLIGLVVLLIGYNQFVILLINRYLDKLVEGFGALLLELIQRVGFQMLVWIMISTIIALAFGIFLLLVSRLFRLKKDISPSKVAGEGNSSINDFLSEKDIEEKNTKVNLPETLEEIEAREKNTLKNKE
jgi:hypothetical protein